MDKLEIAMLRSEQALQLRANPVFEQAFAETRAGIMELWSSLPTSDKEAAYDLHRMCKCLDRVKKCIEVHIDTGKIARKEIEGRKKRLFSLGDR